jgi:RNA polymerase sigma-70 factor (ECF subfamily)
MTRDEFNVLVQQHSRSLYGYAFRILRNQEEAEDAVQEVFIKLWNLGKKLDEYSSIGAFATTMIKNYCIDQIRKKKHFVSEESIGHENQLTDNSSPYQLMESSESGKIISHIIDGLPEIYKVLIIMKEIEGLSYEEIAERTQQNINTLRVTISRARKTIRDEFNKYYYERRGFKEVGRQVL